MFAEELFRAGEAITVSSGSYLLLPTYVTEVEDIRWTNAVYRKLFKIDKEHRFVLTGYYHDGIDTSSGKRRLKVREAGADIAVGTSFQIEYLREYSDLSAEDATPIPFVGKRYLDMLTTLQAYYYYTEQGKEGASNAKTKMQEYLLMLDDARKAFYDDEPDYATSTHPDAGGAHHGPVYIPSSAS